MSKVFLSDEDASIEYFGPVWLRGPIFAPVPTTAIRAPLSQATEAAQLAAQLDAKLDASLPGCLGVPTVLVP